MNQIKRKKSYKCICKPREVKDDGESSDERRFPETKEAHVRFGLHLFVDDRIPELLQHRLQILVRHVVDLQRSPQHHLGLIVAPFRDQPFWRLILIKHPDHPEELRQTRDPEHRHIVTCQVGDQGQKRVAKRPAQLISNLFAERGIRSLEF